MEKYSKYKDSGVEWLGEIPSHWEVIKAKFIWDELFTVSETGNEKLLSVSQYDGITEAKSDSRSESLTGYKLVRENDLVINIMLAWMGGLGVSAYNGIVSPAYCIYRLKRDSNPKFMHYLYKTPLYLAEFARHSTGVIPSRWRMYTDDFGQVLTLLPPKEEQDAIVRYLNDQSSKIDEAIAHQQKMIDLLNERKQIIINNAVTKGLVPNVPMKDSGVDWIGTIPEHWKVRNIQYLFRNRNEYNIPIKSKERLSLSIDVGITLYSEKTTNLDRFKEDYTQYKLAYEGDIVLNSMNMIVGAVGLSHYFGCVSPAYYVIYPTEQNVNKVYYSLLLNSRAIRNVYRILGKGIYSIDRGDGRVNTCRLKVPYNDFSHIKVPLPPLHEQDEIACFIENKFNIIERNIAKIRNQISLLQERKQIIINEVVTGKVKVS